jgi:hypothetical protein
MVSHTALENGLADWSTWSGALFLSLLLHVLALALLYSAEVVQPGLPSATLLPVTIRQPPPPAMPPKAEVVPAPAPVPVPQAPPAEPAPAEPPERKIEIPLPEQQIVSPPEGGIERRPEKTRLLSDLDVTVEEERVRRGEPAPGAESEIAALRPPPDAGAAPPPRRPAAEAPAKGHRALPDLDRLLPDAVKLAREGYGEAAEASPEKDGTQERSERLRSAGVWPPTSGTFGTFDFLPDVREGDITLLNTKADLFAPFVRRVAVRVFQNLLISLRRDLSPTGPSTREQVAAEAVMDPHGELISVDITDRSPRNSLGIDRKLRQACSDGFFDRNPPPGAQASDGNIHFVLRTQVATISDQRGYRLGYQVIFQAGLL